MRYALYTVILSPHQLPFAKELVALVGAANFRYVFCQRSTAERLALGWEDSVPPWGISDGTDEAREWLERCDVLLCCQREVGLFERRTALGLQTFYSSERWFKPPLGMLRLCMPRYLMMIFRFVRLARRSTRFSLLPIGVHAWLDFRRIAVPDSRMTIWGYFVEPSRRLDGSPQSRAEGDGPLRVLWVGRMLALKRLDTLLRAVAKCPMPLHLTLVGDGPERTALEEFVHDHNLGNTVSFLPPVPIDDVRRYMQSHDVYVFPSNGFDGWGAVVSEALEEGMTVLGSYEAGSTATMLPEQNLFHADDWRRLAVLLENLAQTPALLRQGARKSKIGQWSARKAALKFLDMTSWKEKGLHA